MTILDKHKEDIQQLCSRHQVKNLFAFGSVLTEKFNSESDIDLLVDFKPIEVEAYADNYFDLKFSLEETLNRSIDLLEEQAIKNPYFRQSIKRSRQLIYGN